MARVRELLLESLQHRLRADVGVGVFLSGGLDSSAIAGMTAHVIRQGKSLGNDASGKISNLSCFTVQFEKESGLDESGTYFINISLPYGVSNNSQTLHDARRNG